MYSPKPSELTAQLRKIVGDVSGCTAVMDFDSRTKMPRGEMTPSEMHEIKNRVNLLFMFGPSALVNNNKPFWCDESEETPMARRSR